MQFKLILKIFYKKENYSYLLDSRLSLLFFLNHRCSMELGNLWDQEAVTSGPGSVLSRLWDLRGRQSPSQASVSPWQMKLLSPPTPLFQTGNPGRVIPGHDQDIPQGSALRWLNTPICVMG